MGCGPSSLAVAELNRSLKTSEGPQVLHDKLQSSPWLLSTTTSMLSTASGTPLHTACERKQVEVVQRMLSFLSCANLAVVREALQPYCRRYARTLPGTVDEGVRLAVDMVNNKGQTPLMCACVAGSPELVKLLLAQGADPWVTDSCGARTALHYAAMSGNAACIDALLHSLAVRDMSRDGVRYINVRTTAGLTPLHYAAFYDHRGAVEELLRHYPHLNAASNSHSYDVDTACDSMSTPLHFAAVRGNVSIVRQLLRHYALYPTSPGGVRSRDPRLRANHGHQTPWQVAASNFPNHRELLQLLHPGRPLEDVLGLEGLASTALHGAAAHGRAGPPSLAALAAAALQTRLLADLKRLAAEADADARRREARTLAVSAPPGAHPAVDLLGSPREGDAEPRLPSESSPGLMPGFLPNAFARPSSFSGHEHQQACQQQQQERQQQKQQQKQQRQVQSESESEDALCGVCFAEQVAVAPAGCGHGLCGSCAAQLCRVGLAGSRPRPLLCPFCRQEVAGFIALTAVQPVTERVTPRPSSLQPQPWAAHPMAQQSGLRPQSWTQRMQR